MRDHTSSAAEIPHSEPSLLLHVVRGKTGFPDRPLSEFPFVIGGGPECQLRLGGDLPGEACCLLQDGETVLVESLSGFSGLQVDGRVVKAAVVSPGAMIGVGPILFELRRAAEVEKEGISFEIPARTVSRSEPEPVPVADDLVESPRDLSIRSLIDRLESALDKLEEMEARRRSGLAALLEKVIEVAGEQAGGEVSQRKSA